MKKYLKHLFWKGRLMMPFACAILVLVLCYAPSADLLDEEEDLIPQKGEDASSAMPSKTTDFGRMQRMRLQQNLNQLESLKKNPRLTEAKLVAVASRILNDDPENVRALNALGAFYLSKKKTQLAKIILTRALKAHPKNSALHNNRGVVALQQGEVKEAISYFKESVKYRYSNYNAAANLGTLYMDSHAVDSSLDYLELAYKRVGSYLPKGNQDIGRIGNNYAVALARAGNLKSAGHIWNQVIMAPRLPPEVFWNYAILLGKNLNQHQRAFMVLSKVDLLDTAGRYARRVKKLRAYIKKSMESRMRSRKGKKRK